MDEISPAAQLIGAVNTVVNRDGHLIGHNTDGFGFFASLKDFSPRDAHLMILGAGGAAKAIVTQSVLDGAKKSVSMFALSHWIRQKKVLSPYLNRQLATWSFML